MSARQAATRAALVLLAVLTVAPVAAAAQDGEVPTVTLDRTGAKAGETLVVRGSGWSGTDLLYIELCGNGGRHGSSSCDQGHATLTGLGPDGTFSARLTVAKPPVPCPCVVKATSQTTQASASADLAVQDVPVVPLEDQPTAAVVQRSVAITAARLAGRGPWTSWFGQGARRTLVLTVTNTGDVAVHDPPLTITAGKGTDPSGVVPAPELGTIEPGESVTVEVPLRFSSLSFGQHAAQVSIAGFAEPVGAVAATSTYPWALIALAAVLAQLGLLRIRNKVRRRVGAHAAGQVATGGTTVEVAPVAAPAAEGRVPSAEDADDEVEAETDGEAEVEIDLDEEVPANAGAADPISPAGPALDGQRGGAPVTIDLRDADAVVSPRPGGPDGHTPAGPDGDLPNPFEQPSGAQAAGALLVARRAGTEGRALQSRITAQRAAAQEVLTDASATAAGILTAATAQADELVASAAAARAEAAVALGQAQRSVEALLTEARLHARAIETDVERHQAALERAADEGRAALDQMVAAAAARLDARFDEIEQRASSLLADALEHNRAANELDLVPPVNGGATPATEVIGLPAVAVAGRAVAGRTATRLDAAIERAVHRAFQA